MTSRSQYSNGDNEAEQAWVEAGFKPRTAAIIVAVNRSLFAFTIIVSVAALLWIGLHLWPDLDVAAWQAWADENTAFFAPLDDGAIVGIVPDLHSHMGLLLTKRSGRVEVVRHLWFPFDEVPVGLVVAPEAAERWLQLEFEADSFWRDWQAIAEDPGIHVYQHLRRGSPAAAGYRAFVARLQASGSQ